MSPATEQLKGEPVKVRSHIGHAGLVQIIAFRTEGRWIGSVMAHGSGETEAEARESAGLPREVPR